METLFERFFVFVNSIGFFYFICSGIGAFPPLVSLLIQEKFFLHFISIFLNGAERRSFSLITELMDIFSAIFLTNDSYFSFTLFKLSSTSY